MDLIFYDQNRLKFIMLLVYYLLRIQLGKLSGGDMINSKKGFTAIELLVSLAILAISMTSVYNLYMSFIRMQTSESVKIKVQQSARSSLDMMVRDIRMAGLDPAVTHAFGMTAPLNAQSIRFTADRDMDGLLDEPNEADGIQESDLEQMAYEYNGTDGIEMVLFKSDGTEEMRATLVENVSAINFSYLDADAVPTANAEDVRSVEISMTIQRLSGRGRPVSRTLIKRVKCRNLAFH